jgi:predicted CXXCH cytochrome family protein
MSTRLGRQSGLSAAVLALVVLALMATRLPDLFRKRPMDPGLAAYGRGEWQLALRKARDRLSLAPDDRLALRLLARASGRLGRDAETESLYARLGVDGAEAEDFFVLGSALLRRGREGPGIRMLERARQASPDHLEVLRALGEEYRRLGFPIASAGAARKIASIDGREVEGRLLLAPLLVELDQTLGAAEALEFVVAHDPRGELAQQAPEAIRKQLVRAWLRCGRPVDARRVLEPLLSGQDDPETWWLVSRVCLQQDDPAGAKAALARAADFGSDDRTRPDPAPWVGNSGCASCHAKIHKAQQSSRHAHTLAWGSTIAAVSFPASAVRDPGNARVQHRLRAESERAWVESALEDRRFTAVVDYVIGSGNRGQTPIVRDNEGAYWEYRLTRYAAPVGWDTTIHHLAAPEDSLGYLGKPLLEDQVRDCLNCHSTNPDAVRERRLEGAGVHGIDCERCHGPGGNHVHAMKLGFPEIAIAQPRRATGRQRAALCAQCHRAPPGIPDNVTDFIRFQSPNLERSRCFVESAGALDCTTCHNPHRDAAIDASSYEEICLSCHGGYAAKAHSPVPSRHDRMRVAARPCPVNRAERCLTCHMPRVPNVIPHTAYTDHWIRVRRD